jgi:hypothetical protein
MKKTALIGALTALCVIGSGVAAADNVLNDVVEVDDSKVVKITADDPTGATVTFRIQATGGDTGDTVGQGGENCNPIHSGAVTVTFSASQPGVDIAGGSPEANQLVFNDCTASKSLTFTSSTPGDYAIAASTDKSGYQVNSAGFTLVVEAADTDPVITYQGEFLQPVDGGGTINVVKQGRVVPVKLEIYQYVDGDKGDEVTAGAVTFTQRKASGCDAASAGDLVTDTAGSSTPGSAFRWTEEGGQDYWQYNLATRNLSGCLRFDIWIGEDHVEAFILNVGK